MPSHFSSMQQMVMFNVGYHVANVCLIIAFWKKYVGMKVELGKLRYTAVSRVSVRWIRCKYAALDCECQQILDIMCPRVSIRFRRSPEDSEVQVTVSTHNATQFRLCISGIRPRAFANVRQVVKSWPLTVKALHDHVPSSGDDNEITSLPLYHRVTITIDIKMFSKDIALMELL